MIIAVTEVICYVTTEFLGLYLTMFGYYIFTACELCGTQKEKQLQRVSAGREKHIFLQACHFLPYWIFFFFSWDFYCLWNDKCVLNPQPVLFGYSSCLKCMFLLPDLAVCVLLGNAVLIFKCVCVWRQLLKSCALVLNPDPMNLATNISYSCFYLWSWLCTEWLKLTSAHGSTGSLSNSLIGTNLIFWYIRSPMGDKEVVYCWCPDMDEKISGLALQHPVVGLEVLAFSLSLSKQIWPGILSQWY